MKLFSSVLVFILSSSTVFATPVVRVCPSDILSCKLEKLLPTGEKVLVASSFTQFDGTEGDRPSLPYDTCKIKAALELNDNLIYHVIVDEGDQTAAVTVLQKINNGANNLPYETVFNVTKGHSFYYRYNDGALTCTLNK
jgi:hypothetical protein